MRLLQLAAILLLKLQDSLGLTVTNTISNSRPRLGETITLSCHIAGGTASGVTWWKDKHIYRRTVYVSSNCNVVAEQYKSRLTNIQCDANNYNFQLRNVRVSDGLAWVCEADGLEARTRLLLDVFVPHNVRIKTRKTTVNEHESVRFECVTSGGNPKLVTRYQWLWRKSGSTAAQVIQDTETSAQNGKVLEITRIQYDMSGRYSCKAWNLGGMGQASKVLNVLFSPRIDPDREARMKYVVAGELGKEASFKLFIIANPTPASTGYTWCKDGDVLSNSSQDYEITTKPKFSKLIIKSVTSSDFTNYTCSVKTRRFQAKVFKFKLLKQGPPSAPSGLKVINSTAVAATLEWISEFNGGYKQRFYVQYKKKSESHWDVASEVPQGGISDPGLNETVYHKVMDLESNVWYAFWVRSKNSIAGNHTSDYSNIAIVKTPEKPELSLIGVIRDHRETKVTVIWEKVIGRYTALKIRYCQTGTEDCIDYTVTKPEDNYATFLVDADKTYYYEMIIEDGGDVVYRSKVIKDEVDDKSSSQVVDDKTNIVVDPVAGGLVGVCIVVITGIIVAVVLWKRGVVRCGKRQSQRPANDAVDAEDTRVEFQTTGNEPVATYANIGTDYVNDVPHPEHTISQTPAQLMVTGRHVPVHGVHGDERTCSNDDVDAYDYVDSLPKRQRGVSGQNPVPEPPENETERAAADQEHEQNLSSEERGGQAVQKPEATSSDLEEAQPGKGTAAESGCSQTNGAHGQTPSRSDDNTARGEELPYEQLGPVAPVKRGEYLDLRQLSSE